MRALVETNAAHDAHWRGTGEGAVTEGKVNETDLWRRLRYHLENFAKGKRRVYGCNRNELRMKKIKT